MTDMVGLVTVDEDVIRTDYARDVIKKNMHFVVLRYVGDLQQARRTFKRICYRYELGETWFMQGSKVANDFYILSASFTPFPWSRYRKILFDKGIDEEFKKECLERKCGYINKREIRSRVYIVTPKRSRSDPTLRQALSALLFK